MGHLLKRSSLRHIIMLMGGYYLFGLMCFLIFSTFGCTIAGWLVELSVFWRLHFWKIRLFFKILFPNNTVLVFPE